MTKEAKVGLLLGLGFIIAIAIVLRDVHQAGQTSIEETRMVSHDADKTNLPEAVELSAVVHRLTSNGTPLQAQSAASEPENVVTFDRQTFPAQAAASGNRPPVESPSMRNFSIKEVEHRLIENDITPRYQRALPQNLNDLQAGEAERDADLVKHYPDKFDYAAKQAVNKVVDPQQELMDRGVFKPVKKQSPKTYVIRKGDSLSSIAVKFYGREEGNRLANIRKIYEANKDRMESIDTIIAGKTLVIPPLAGKTFAVVKQEKTNSRGKTSSGSSYRFYTVKKGETLWEIAAEQLGSGARFTDIAALNAHTLSDEDSVYPGMQLKLPR